jgi:hypothetical protein
MEAMDGVSGSGSVTGVVDHTSREAEGKGLTISRNTPRATPRQSTQKKQKHSKIKGSQMTLYPAL